MSESHNRESYDAVVYLISCALGGVTPSEEYLANKDIGMICSLAVRHSVMALVAHSLEKIGRAPAKAVERKNMAIRRAILFDVERERLLKIFESRGIRYLPLKGVLLKELYPSVGLREMADNDILFDEAYRAEVRDIMVESGYEVECYGRFNHDVYVKKPLFNFEMHVDLFSSYEEKEFCDYYKDLFESRLIRLEGTEYGYKMSDEDFYIYLKLHEYKHYSYGGTGLRSLADTYVFLREKGEILDFDYIDRELSSLGVSEYEKTMRNLAMKVFSPEEAAAPSEAIYKILEGEELKVYEYMCFSGTYGTSEHNLANALLAYERICGGDSTKAKRKYLWRRIFPPMEVYEIYYPFYYKHKILLPILFIKRICRAIFQKPKKVWYSFVQIMKFDKKARNEKKDLQK